MSQGDHELQHLDPASDPRDSRAFDEEGRSFSDMRRAYSPAFSGKMHNRTALEELEKRTVKKLDFILLPFLALLFLFNSLDKSNIGNAETADFTKDVGLEPQDLNTAVAVFYTCFVSLQPLGAALGRKFGMAVWVPSCMLVWGICTALHCWVHSKWQLILLRMVIGTLEAGFYPTTVSYLSLFYTRFEFGRRLAIFYGQSAVAGALGGVLAWGVFSRFPNNGTNVGGGLKSWQVLFLIEGATTIVLAGIGFFWLPHNARTAWFLSDEERAWAEERIRRDRDGPSNPISPKNDAESSLTVPDDEGQIGVGREESRGLLSSSSKSRTSTETKKAVTDDRGLSRSDVTGAVLDWKVWYILGCNILSSMPATAFSVFMPLVLKHLSDSAASANLLTAPPFLIGAVALYIFTYWSDKSRTRLVPILWGIGVMVVGLTAVVTIPHNWILLRYASLCMLMAGTFVASPLTVAWFSGNNPETGKRSVVLGINGWGNFAGVLSSMLFQPRFAPTYAVPFFITLGAVSLSFAGYVLFWGMLLRENARRKKIVSGWTDEDLEAEREHGLGPSSEKRSEFIRTALSGFGASRFMEWLDDDEGRKGDERLTFVYGL